MTEVPANQDIEELVRRLESSPYPIADIREAGQILVGVQPHDLSYKMAIKFSDSTHAQVRQLGMAMMEAVAPHSEAAQGFLSGAREAARLMQNGSLVSEESKPAAPDYSALGQVIKMMLRQGRENRGKGAKR